MRIILASGSPRRRELLEQIGLQFEVMVSHVKEDADVRNPGKLVETLSRQKAEAVFRAAAGKEALLVIAADTVVVRKGKVLGKPANKKAAVKMLEKLSGKEHQVYTGVTLLYRPEGRDGSDKAKHKKVRRGKAKCGEVGCGKVKLGKVGRGNVQRKTFHEVTKVRFFPMAAEEIRAYADTGDPLDKAGAYGIQGIFARYVESIDGDYNNVVGLPVGKLYQEAKEWLEE